MSGYSQGTDYGYAVVFKAFSDICGRGGLQPEGIRCYRNLKNVKAALAPDNYPMFVRFRDPTDPKTVENLLEFKPCPDEHGVPNRTVCLTKDRFAEAFGAGVALKSVSIEMTDEPVTVGIVKKYAPPSSTIKDYMIWFRTLPYGDPRRIGLDTFGGWGE